MVRTNRAYNYARNAQMIPDRVSSQPNMATEEKRLQETAIHHEYFLSSVYETVSRYCYFKQFIVVKFVFL